MINKKVFCAVASIGIASSVYSNAIDFNKDFYGKFNANIGYSFQGYTGDVTDIIDEMEISGNTNKYSHSIVLGAGFNTYYKLNNTIEPFAGIYFEGRIPVSKYNVYDYYNSSYQYGEKMSIKEVFNTQFKFGAKLNVVKDFAIQPYYSVGFNVLMLNYKDVDDYDNDSEKIKKSKVGFTTGAGVDFIIKDRFTVGVDYRYGQNKMSLPTDIKVKTHTGTIKVGVQF